jgi:hypothetical protein
MQSRSRAPRVLQSIPSSKIKWNLESLKSESDAYSWIVEQVELNQTAFPSDSSLKTISDASKKSLDEVKTWFVKGRKKYEKNFKYKFVMSIDEKTLTKQQKTQNRRDGQNNRFKNMTKEERERSSKLKSDATKKQNENRTKEERERISKLQSAATKKQNENRTKEERKRMDQMQCGNRMKLGPKRKENAFQSSIQMQ